MARINRDQYLQFDPPEAVENLYNIGTRNKGNHHLVFLGFEAKIMNLLLLIKCFVFL